MNDFIKKLKPLHVLKAASVLLLVVIIIALAIRLVGSSFNTVLNKSYSPSQSPAVDYGDSIGGGGYDNFDGSYGAPELSQRNIIALPPYPGGGATTGDNAEEFEVTDYSSTIETRNLNRTCEDISSLKAFEYVIFENSNESDKYCNYTFKVERSHREEILQIIKDLNPRELIENTYTIKNIVEDFTSELDILVNKLTAINETLSGAIDSYDEITRVAVNANDAEALAKIIDSKIKLIERLSQDKINVSTQIDRLNRSKAQQLDRLDYIYFHVSIYANKIIDGQALRDSWKASLQEFIRETNKTSQDLSVRLFTFLLSVVQIVIYLVIALYVTKHLWKWAKKFWKS